MIRVDKNRLKIFDMKGIFMKCSKCQTEFEGAVCPNCGAQAAQPQQPQQQYRQPVQYGSTVTEYKKKKKPVYKRAWFVILVIIAALAIIISVANAVGIGEKIVWSEMVMGELLPEPPNSKGDIHENSTAYYRSDRPDGIFGYCLAGRRGGRSAARSEIACG